MVDKATVGFIGVGNMGWPMAACLVKAGFPVLINDQRREVANNFVQHHGGTAPDTLKQLAAGSDVIVTMLPTSVIVEHVLGGGGDNVFAADSLINPDSQAFARIGIDQRQRAQFAPVV